MRLLRISTNYRFYLHQFFAKHPELSGKPFAEQKAALDYDCFSWPDSWAKSLQNIGYEAEQLVCNAEPIQKAWAQEKGLTYTEDNWLLDIAKAQILEYKPDILFVNDYVTFSYHWLTELRTNCPFIKLIVGWCGAPFSDASVFKAYDVVLSCIPEMVAKFRSMGHISEHLNHAFDPGVLERLELKRSPHHDFTFVGQIVHGNQYHLEREKILEGLVRKVKIRIYTPSAKLGLNEEVNYLVRNSCYNLVHGLHELGTPQAVIDKIPILNRVSKWNSRPLAPANPKLKRFIKPPVFGLEMFQTLIDSKVTFNSHIDVSPLSASNMRLFEATGVSTCLITDWKENLPDLFEPDKEVVTYKSVDECIEKVRWLIDHPTARQAIATAGQARTLKEHTFTQRAKLLDSIIKRELSNRDSLKLR